MQNKILNNYRMRFILTFMLFFINCNAFGDNMQNIIITIKNKKYEAILYDNSTTKELIKKFPITITMSDLNGNEKYYNFSKSFSTSSENVANINKGDIMLFGDNCLVIFYFIKSQLWKSMLMIPKDFVNFNLAVFYIEYSIIILAICQIFYLFNNFMNKK